MVTHNSVSKHSRQSWTSLNCKRVQVSKTVTAAEAAAQAESEAKRRNKAGLDSVLASLQAAKKVNVLDKSRSDWTDFKTGDTKVCLRSIIFFRHQMSTALSRTHVAFSRDCNAAIESLSSIWLIPRAAMMRPPNLT